MGGVWVEVVSDSESFTLQIFPRTSERHDPVLRRRGALARRPRPRGFAPIGWFFVFSPSLTTIHLDKAIGPKVDYLKIDEQRAIDSSLNLDDKLIERIGEYMWCL